MWVLTWFSYWILIKQQTSVVNVVGTLFSASVILSLRFSILQSAASKVLYYFTPQISKRNHLSHLALGSHSNEKIQVSPVAFTTRIRTAKSTKHEDPNVQAVLKTQEQETESIQVEEEDIQPPPSKSNGCPKNLEYFAMKPRPKKTPEECFSCKNLITCVCLTSN